MEPLACLWPRLRIKPIQMNMESASALQSAAAGATTTIAISGPDDKVCGKRTSDNISPGKGDDSDVPITKWHLSDSQTEPPALCPESMLAISRALTQAKTSLPFGAGVLTPET